MKTALIFIFAFGISFSQAQNNSVYNQTWISGAYQQNIKKWNFRLDGSYRSIESFKYNRQFIIREISSYNFNSHWQMGTGPCLSWQYPYGSLKPVMELRPTIQLIGRTNISNNKYENGKFENNKSEFSIRFRWEFRYFKNETDFLPIYHRGRILTRLKIALNEKSSLIFQEEMMFQRNPTDKFRFQTNRIYIGWSYKFKNFFIEPALMFQFIKRSPTENEIDNNFILNVMN